MNNPFVRTKLRELDGILDTLECIAHRVPAPRSIWAWLYSVIFLALAFALAPHAWGLARGAAAAAAGFGAFKFLEKFGPGRPSWWSRLSDQLWSYEPIDTEALARLRKDLVANARQGQRNAIAQVLQWSRTELAAIAGRGRRGA
ncbi:MAG: hypothetical protein ACYCST_02460 [Acidimicrobiales bacterium]